MNKLFCKLNRTYWENPALEFLKRAQLLKEEEIMKKYLLIVPRTDHNTTVNTVQNKKKSNM